MPQNITQKNDTKPFLLLSIHLCNDDLKIVYVTLFMFVDFSV